MADACKFKIGAYWLIPLESANAEELADYQLRNKDRIAPFSPKRTDTFYSSAYWRSSKRRAAKERREETAFRWVLEQDGCVLGQINMDQVARGAFQSATLGYSLDSEVEGRGLMTDCLREVINYAFVDLNLHRLAACHVPENERSAAVLERLGFHREGFAKAYLRLNGEWKDHVLTALINPHYN